MSRSGVTKGASGFPEAPLPFVVKGSSFISTSIEIIYTGRVTSLTVRARRHAALGDPVRLAIVDFVRDSDRSVNAIREYLELSSPLVSHHLDVLEEAGLIVRSKSLSDGRKRFVSLQHSSLPGDHGSRMPNRVIFVCTENAARSQLASALWMDITGLHATSAGTNPAAAVHPLAVEVGRARGLDLRTARPRRFNTKLTRGSLVITVCDSAFEEIGPELSDWHWSIPDPSVRATKQAFTEIAGLIEQRINHVKGASRS